MDLLEPTGMLMSELSERLKLSASFDFEPNEMRPLSPVAITITTSDQTKTLPKFVEHVGGPGRVPSLRVLSCNGLALIFGLHELVVLRSESSEITVIDLYRGDAMDFGFAKVQALKMSDGVLVIYESGVISLSVDSIARWHVEKYWDDHLVACANGRLDFAGDYSSYALNIETGIAET